MRTPAWWVGLWCVVLVACEPMGGVDAGDDGGSVVVDAGRSTDAGAEDAGVVDAGVDAGTPDAGGFDAGPQDSVTLSASTTFDDRVQLTWDAGDVFALGWVIERDGQMVAQVGGGLRRYDDFNAPAGRFEAFDASASQTFGHAIELEWSAPDASAGPMTRYRVRMSQPPYLASPNAMGQRAPPVLSGWRVTRADGGWLLSPSESSLEDTAAPGATLSVQSLSATARPEDWVSAVMLNVDASVTTAPNPVDYVVTAWSDAGVERALAVTGHRRLSGVVYQWQRSDADSPDASWSDLPRVHGVKWFDAEAPFNEGRYYRVALRHDGVEHVSNEVRALLWRPRFVSGNGQFCMLREDGFAKCEVFDLGYLGPVVDFTTTPTGACGVHADGGVSCWHDGMLIHPALPPVERILAGDRTCAWADAGVFCLDGTTAPELRALSTPPTWNTLCGWPRDGGDITCNGVPIAGATAVAAPDCAIFDGGWLSCAPMNIARQLPMTWGEWISLKLDRNGDVCMRTNQHVTSCHPVGSAQSVAPMWAAQEFVTWEKSGDSNCGISTSGRLVCRGTRLTPLSIPPPGPLRDVAAGLQRGAIFLNEAGRIDAQGSIHVSYFPNSYDVAPTPDDQLVAISGGIAGVSLCGLIGDGTPKCLGGYAPLPGPFVMLGSYENTQCGLRPNGGIECWNATNTSPLSGSQWTWLGGTHSQHICALDSSHQPTCASPPLVPMPTTPLREVGVMAGSVCGLTFDDTIVCSPTTPSGLNTRRYRHLSVSWTKACAVSLEGTVECWGHDLSEPAAWNDFVSISVGDWGFCGKRTDDTGVCVSFDTGESLGHTLP